MTETKPVKDRYPYEATWKSLTKQQQQFVKRRANKAKLPIPEIIKIYYIEEK